MATGQIKVAQAFMRGDAATSGNMVARGDHVYSYNELIAQFNEDDNSYILNPTKFSSTTSRHQNAIRQALIDTGYQLRDHTLDGWEVYTHCSE